MSRWNEVGGGGGGGPRWPWEPSPLLIAVWGIQSRFGEEKKEKERKEDGRFLLLGVAPASLFAFVLPFRLLCQPLAFWYAHHAIFYSCAPSLSCKRQSMAAPLLSVGTGSVHLVYVWTRLPRLQSHGSRLTLREMSDLWECRAPGGAHRPKTIHHAPILALFFILQSAVGLFFTPQQRDSSANLVAWVLPIERCSYESQCQDVNLN